MEPTKYQLDLYKKRSPILGFSANEELPSARDSNS